MSGTRGARTPQRGTSGAPAPADRSRRSPQQLIAIRDSLAPRDLAIVDSLARMRFLTTGHIESLHFGDHATASAASRICRRVLARLHRERVIEHLERRIGGVRAGSMSYVWRIGAVGDRLLRQREDAPRDRRHEPSLRSLDHTLAVADAVVGITKVTRTGPVELVRADVEPSSWRRFLGSGGAREVLKPDLYVVTAAEDYEDHWFIEIDRGTESIPTVIKQCHQYEACRRTGTVQSDIEVFPYVVWATPDEQRAAKLSSAIRASRRLDSEHFRVTTHGGLVGLVTGAGS